MGNERIQTALIRQLEEVLQKNDVTHDFQYAVTEVDNDSLIYSSLEHPDRGIFDSKIKTIIFDESFFFKAYTLYVYFPGKNKIILKSIWLIILSSVAIVCAIIIMILLFIRTLLHQKRLSEMKSDFIHNMTHEFKTPISNIDLALHTFKKKNDESKYLNGDIINIIEEENTRLKNNVDLILQTSFIDHDELKLHKEPVNINDLLNSVLRTYAHDLINNGSTFKKHLYAADAMVIIDETHFTNAVCNIIDNAIKYSHDEVVITVKTENIDHKLVISIKDKGIGISEKDQKRIFEKFYRVHTGKLHDVKGFGLGLTYSKYVVEAHKGEIMVRSEQGKGSEFKIILEQ